MARRHLIAPGPGQDALFEQPVATPTAVPRPINRRQPSKRTQVVIRPTAAHAGTAAMVRRFHEAFGLPIAAQPTGDLPRHLVALRVELVREELEELTVACDHRDLVGIADALGDIIYVVYGAALSFGIDLDAVVSEVHRSNMSKLDRDGQPILRADGKVLKGPHYRPPDIAGVLDLTTTPSHETNRRHPDHGPGGCEPTALT